MANNENEKNFKLKPPNTGKPRKTESDNKQGGEKKPKGGEQKKFGVNIDHDTDSHDTWQ